MRNINFVLHIIYQSAFCQQKKNKNLKKHNLNCLDMTNYRLICLLIKLSVMCFIILEAVFLNKKGNIECVMQQNEAVARRKLIFIACRIC